MDISSGILIAVGVGLITLVIAYIYAMIRQAIRDKKQREAPIEKPIQKLAREMAEIEEEERKRTDPRRFERTLPEDFEVVRIYEEYQTYIEPSLSSLEEANPNLTNLDRLIWHAAVLKADIGMDVVFRDAQYHINGVLQPGHYQIQVGTHNVSSYDYQDAWTYLVGAEMGWLAHRDLVKGKK